jgi:hypothetical protein
MNSQAADPIGSPTPSDSSLPLEKIPKWLRLFLVALPTALTLLLIIAWKLQPDPRGYGTHHQLGFPDCTFIVLWGIPCPMCGMTTSWSNLMHGNWLTSFRSNPGGALLGITSMLAIPICIWRAWLGVATKNNWLSRFTLLWFCLVIFVIALFWIWQIQFRRPLF